MGLLSKMFGKAESGGNQPLLRKVGLVATMTNPDKNSLPEWERFMSVLRKNGLVRQDGSGDVIISSSDVTTIHVPDSHTERVRHVLRTAVDEGKIDGAKLKLTIM